MLTPLLTENVNTEIHLYFYLRHHFNHLHHLHPPTFNPYKHFRPYETICISRIKKKYSWPDTDLYGEPGIAHIFYVEESIVRVCAVFVQAPHSGVTPGHRDVPDHRHPHVRVGLQAEGEDGGADEEDWDHSDHLNIIELEMLSRNKQKSVETFTTTTPNKH